MLDMRFDVGSTGQNAYPSFSSLEILVEACGQLGHRRKCFRAHTTFMRVMRPLTNAFVFSWTCNNMIVILQAFTASLSLEFLLQSCSSDSLSPPCVLLLLALTVLSTAFKAVRQASLSLKLISTCKNTSQISYKLSNSSDEVQAKQKIALLHLLTGGITGNSGDSDPQRL